MSSTKHIVICNWNDKGLSIIKELHAPIVRQKRPIVIVSERLEDVDLPDKEDLPELEDVYLIKGDPTQEHTLKRANVPLAYSIIVLADPEQKHLADAKNVLVCMAIKDLCNHEGESVRNVMVEGVDPKNLESFASRRGLGDRFRGRIQFEAVGAVRTSPRPQHCLRTTPHHFGGDERSLLGAGAGAARRKDFPGSGTHFGEDSRLQQSGSSFGRGSAAARFH